MTMLGNQFAFTQNSDGNTDTFHAPNDHAKLKQQLADSFSRAAKHYHDNAQVQQRIADHLLKQIKAMNNELRSNWLDLGCGSGYLLNQLAARSSTNNYFGIDIAHGMLIEAQRANQAHFFNADAESLPLCAGSIDHLVSSMALQWVSHPMTVMPEIARVLSKDGTASLAILRADSLPELHQGWQHLAQGSRVNQFASRSDWQNGIEQAGLSVKRIEKQSFQTLHRNLFDLLYSIKGIGAGPTLNKTAHPLRRADLKNLAQWWQQEHQIDNSLVLTYTVDFWQLTL